MCIRDRLLGGGIWYLRNYQGDFFSNFLQRRGDAAMAGEHYTTALRYYRWAWELDDTDPDLAVSLASAYAHTDNYTKAEYTLCLLYTSTESNFIYLQFKSYNI